MRCRILPYARQTRSVGLTGGLHKSALLIQIVYKACRNYQWNVNWAGCRTPTGHRNCKFVLITRLCLRFKVRTTTSWRLDESKGKSQTQTDKIPADVIILITIIAPWHLQMLPPVTWTSVIFVHESPLRGQNTGECCLPQLSKYMIWNSIFTLPVLLVHTRRKCKFFLRTRVISIIRMSKQIIPIATIHYHVTRELMYFAEAHYSC